MSLQDVIFTFSLEGKKKKNITFLNLIHLMILERE